MAAVNRCFFDTSVLVRGLVDFGDPTEPSLQIFDALAAERLARPVTAWHCCLELYAVITRLPEEYRVQPSEALVVIREEVLHRFDVHQLPASDLESLLTRVDEEGVVGGRIYDLHIAEVAHRSGADVVITNNRRHFTSLLKHGTRVLTAEEAIKGLSL